MSCIARSPHAGWRVAGACIAAWKVELSASSCVRRRLSTGVRSRAAAEPPCVVTTKRVFMWAVGTLGLKGWAISETPVAKNRRIVFGAGNLLANSGENCRTPSRHARRPFRTPGPASLP